MTDFESEHHVAELFLLTAATSIYFYIKQNKKRRRRRVWSEKWLLRRNLGRGLLNMVDNELKPEDPASYKNFLRMNEETFNELLELIVNKIAKQDTCMRECISAKSK